MCLTSESIQSFASGYHNVVGVYQVQTEQQNLNFSYELLEYFCKI